MQFRLVAVAYMLLPLSAVPCVKAQEKLQPRQTSASLSAETAAAEAHSRKLWEDFRNRNKTALSATLAEGFRGLEEGGDFFDAKGYLSGLDGFELKGYTLSDYMVTPLATGAVLVSYHANYEGAAGGETTHGNAGFSEVWVRRGSNWKLQYLQETYVK